MAEWARIVNSTIADYARGFEEAVLRERKLLDWMKRDGHIEYNCDGDGFKWQVKKSQRMIEQNNGTQVLTFAPVNTFKQASLDYQGYALGEAQTKREKLKNRGTPALIKVWAGIIDELMSDMHDRFSEELYVDVAATGNGSRITGVDSMFGVAAPTNTIDSSQTTTTSTRSANAADPVGSPSATYAGLSTSLGNEGGSWSGVWPHTGKGDAEYDYFSGLIVNYTSSFFGSTSWADNCVAAIRFANSFANRNIASEGRTTDLLLHLNLFRLFKDKKDGNERVVVNQGSKDREYGLPIEDEIVQDGVRISWEFGIPNDSGGKSIGFGFNRKQMYLKSMQDKLFDAEGPLYDISARAWKVAVDFLGQLQFKTPRAFYKLQQVA